MTNHERDIHRSEDRDHESTVDSAGTRGTDDRRGTVNPAHNPAPRSPDADRPAIRKGEEMLERVKPY